jgi:hypothetical protein
MRVGIVAAILAVLVMSCAPRFTVYLGMRERMNTNGITLIAVDTVKVAGCTQKRLSYSMTRDMSGLDRLFLAGKIRKAKKELDSLSR